MVTSEFNPLAITRIVCALAVAIQTLELLTLRQTFNDQGVWRWEILKSEFAQLPTLVRKLPSLFLAYRPFMLVLAVRLFAAAGTLLISNFYILAFLLFSNLLISIRWRGAFNGGSDAMTTIVLSALTISALFPNNTKVQLGCLYYVAIQTCLSYFLSGITKVRSPNWRSGATLSAFLTSGIYLPPKFLLTLVRHRPTAALMAWSLIGFECFFPIALVNHGLCVVLLICGVIFHICNAYVLGLNRFLLIWLSAYPIIFWCSL